jgi:radical SAM enzyme (TIGR01210 family)
VTWPAVAADRDRFVLAHRPARPVHDPWRSQGALVEEEAGVRVLTIFLTGRECPWRCAMCDLWQYTIEADTPAGAIPAQIDAACRGIPHDETAPSVVKLYNAGSFFDPRAVPESDYAPIARLLQPFDRVIVECHPSLVGTRVDRFLGVLRGPALEVAMGLETAHPGALEQLHKRMDEPSFRRAAAWLSERGVALRVFLLIAPPFVPAGEQDEWLARSIDVAVGCGASTISLIPARGGNGTMEVLAREGRFTPPSREMIARSLELARARAGRARVLLDPWSAS